MNDRELYAKVAEATGWSHTEIAERAGTSPQNLSHVKAGRRHLTDGQRYLLGEVLGWTPSTTKSLFATAKTTALMVLATVTLFMSATENAYANQALTDASFTSYKLSRLNNLLVVNLGKA